MKDLADHTQEGVVGTGGDPCVGNCNRSMYEEGVILGLMTG